MTRLQPYMGALSATLCLTLIACGGSQERTKIGDRTSARDKVQNSKLLKAEAVVQSCGADSKNTDDKKEILSLDGLAKGLITAKAQTLFASSFTSRVRITDANGDDLKNKQLSQTFLLEYGLQYNSATLKDIAPSLLNIVLEDCEKVVMEIPAVNEEPSLFFQMARLDIEHASTISALRAEPEDFANEQADKDSQNEADNHDDTSTQEKNTVEKEIEDVESDEGAVDAYVAGNTMEFLIDLNASSKNMVVLIHPTSQVKIIVKLVGDETLQVITEKPDQLTACGETHNFQLRNEATLVWGKNQLEPVNIDYELYQTMLDLSNNNELLSNGAEKNENGRRSKGGTIQSVSLPESFLGQYDKAINQYHNKESNVFDIQSVSCE